MSSFASGKKSYGISDRSGFRYKLNTMRKEWTGMLVGPDEFEQKHPQLETRRKVVDPQALRDPRPDATEVLDVFVGVPLVENPTLRSPVCFGQVGTVLVETN
mgnify:CR=1 FL=1|jgi:hypothetical protein|tara:strand:+ start:697 stop:1002 length:306 start_codon:yes stop_codon:yes gene_type:complete